MDMRRSGHMHIPRDVQQTAKLIISTMGESQVEPSTGKHTWA